MQIRVPQPHRHSGLVSLEKDGMGVPFALRWLDSTAQCLDVYAGCEWAMPQILADLEYGWSVLFR